MTIQLTDGTSPVTDAQVLIVSGEAAQLEASALPGGRYYFNDVTVKEVVTIGFPQRNVLPVSLEFMFENAAAVWITVVINPNTGEIKDIETKITERRAGQFNEMPGNRRVNRGNSANSAGGNDLCAGAIPIFDGATAFSTVGATTDGVGDGSCQFDGQTYQDIWYSYEATCTGDLTVSTCNAADYDTDLVVYDGGCGSALLGCQDDTAGCAGFSTELTVPVVAGNTYTIRIGGFNAGDEGSGTVTLSCDGGGGGGMGGADECEDATLIDCNSTTLADNSGATDNATDPEFSCIFLGPGNGVGSLWFKFVATDTSAFLDTNDSDAPADDSVIAVYDGTCGSLVEIACSEDEGIGLLSEVCVDGLTIGNTYYIQLASFSASDVGEYTLNLTCPCPGPPSGRCCYDGGLSCDDIPEADCLALGGEWDETLTCASDPCPIQPGNDDCDGAEDLGGLPASVVVDTTAATTDNANGCGVASGPFQNVWYTVTGTGNTITATTCNAGSAVGDTKISVYCGDCDDLQCVTGNDDSCVGFDSFQSTASWCSQAGVTYFISVGGFADGDAGVIQLDVSDNGVACSATGDELCIPTGSCCLSDGSCAILTEADCVAAGGSYNGDGTDCGANGVADGSFESGGGPWTVASIQFGTPLCTVGFCGFGGGTGPRTGDWWSWFGGAFGFEAGSVEQSITISSDTLDLYLENIVSSGNGSDFMRVLIDGNVEFSVLEGNATYAFGYTLVSIDTSAYNDGGSHTFRIESETLGDAITNFFVDDVFTAGASPCETCVTLDFEADDDGNPVANGQAISNQFDDLVVISGSGVNLGPAAFDSDPAGPNLPLNQDPDLLVDQGNVLILQNAGFPAQTGTIFNTPNDSSGGGTLAFDFVFPVSPRSVDLVEIDLYPLPQNATVTLIDSSFNTRTFTVPSGWTTDILIDGGSGVGTLDLQNLGAQPGFASVATGSEDAGFDEDDVVRIEIWYASSAAVDNLEVCY